jgi:hypothetical protein
MLMGRDISLLLPALTVHKLWRRLSSPGLKEHDPRMKLCLRKPAGMPYGAARNRLMFAAVQQATGILSHM